MGRRVTTTGTVVRWDHRRVGTTTALDKQRSLPVVRFTTEDGSEVEAMARVALDLGVYRTGQSAEVEYDVDAPEDATIRLGGLGRHPVLAFLLFAVVVLILLVVVFPMVASRLL